MQKFKIDTRRSSRVTKFIPVVKIFKLRSYERLVGPTANIRIPFKTFLKVFRDNKTRKFFDEQIKNILNLDKMALNEIARNFVYFINLY